MPCKEQIVQPWPTSVCARRPANCIPVWAGGPLVLRQQPHQDLCVIGGNQATLGQVTAVDVIS